MLRKRRGVRNVYEGRAEREDESEQGLLRVSRIRVMELMAKGRGGNAVEPIEEMEVTANAEEIMLVSLADCDISENFLTSERGPRKQSFR